MTTISSQSNLVSVVAGRLRQGFTALRPVRLSDHQRALIQTALSDQQAALIFALPPYDQVHLCRVHERLHAAGETDRDLLVAALLHDVGKRDDGVTVRLPHRVAHVLLRRFAPRLLTQLSRPPARGWRQGLVLTEHHAALGAMKSEAVGCSPRVCWLIAHHEDAPPPDDDELRRLIAADDAC